MDSYSNLNAQQFEELLQDLAEGWNAGDARKAADCFTKDAIYLEPPDKQLYKGREALYAFFEETARIAPMQMTWHHLLFDEEKQIGVGEYTFAWNARILHGVVILQLLEGKIQCWREYQYPSSLDWEMFVGESAFRD